MALHVPEPGDESKIAILYREASHLLDNGNCKETLIKLNEILTIDPNNIAAWKMKAQTLDKIGKTETAKVAYEKLQILEYIRDSSYESVQKRRQAQKISALLKEAFDLSDSGDYKRALIQFNEILTIEPNNIEVWKGKAQTLNILGKTVAAKIAEEKIQNLEGRNTKPRQINDNKIREKLPHKLNIKKSENRTMYHKKNCADEILNLLIKKHGISIIENPVAFNGLLKDYCKGEFKKEVRILLTSVEEEIPQDIITKKNQITFAILSSQLIQRLDDCGYSKELAQWAVYTWAEVLGVDK